MSRASTSAVNLAYAFLLPSGLFQSFLVSHRLLSFSSVGKEQNNIPDKRIDLYNINIIQLLQRILDLPLIGLDIDNEDERIILLNFLHGAFGVQGMHNDFVVVESRLVWNRLAWVSRVSCQPESLGSVEGGGESDFSCFVAVYLSKL